MLEVERKAKSLKNIEWWWRLGNNGSDLKLHRGKKKSQKALWKTAIFKKKTAKTKPEKEHQRHRIRVMGAKAEKKNDRSDVEDAL